MPNYNILVVDDEQAQRETLSGFLEKKGYHSLTASSGREAIEKVQSLSVDLILTDLRMPDLDGQEVLKRAKEINPDIDVVVMTAYGSIDSATLAMKAGAVDFLTKPIDLTQLEIILDKTLERKQLLSENRRLRTMVDEKFKLPGIVTSSSAMDEALSVTSRVAKSKASILITGESGTGKELIAKVIHHASDRSDGPFVAVNMAALPDNLVESELFGHEKGAFTGADKFRKGRFEMADVGTLFIDEVGDIPLTTQVKLLRVLQEQQFERVGSSNPVRVNVRVIAATNKNLEKMVSDGTFREDFYYRLNVVKIALPPLRKRKTDIPLLVDHFIRRFTESYGKPVKGFSKEAMDLLIKYSFPGNVRELENIVERAIVLARDDMITTSDLPGTVKGESLEKTCIETTSGNFQDRVESFEKELIIQALQESNGVQTKAAELLGMTERHLRYKLKKYGMKN
jgi:two-component system NtrC family response regulator